MVAVVATLAGVMTVHVMAVGDVVVNVRALVRVAFTDPRCAHVLACDSGEHSVTGHDLPLVSDRVCA